MLSCKKGFSLAELLIVVAIALIISAIAVPAYNRYRARSIQEKAVTWSREFIDAYKGAYAASMTSFQISGDTNLYPVSASYTATLPEYEDSTGEASACVVSIDMTISSGAAIASYNSTATNAGHGDISKCWDRIADTEAEFGELLIKEVK